MDLGGQLAHQATALDRRQTGIGQRRINEYRYNAISRARSARDFLFFGVDIDYTSTFSWSTTVMRRPWAAARPITDAGTC